MSKKKSSTPGKDRVVHPNSKALERDQEEEEEETEKEEEEVEDEEGEVEEQPKCEGDPVPVVQRPTFNIKQTDFVQLTPELASRLLHPNPCCFLTTIPPATKDSVGDNVAVTTQELNASE